jgi:hypothetical protein
LLSELPDLAATGYWLVRVELAELVAGLEPLACAFVVPGWCGRVSGLFLRLLADEDGRVRAAAAAGLAALSSSLGLAQVRGAVLRIHDILGWVRIRIRGSMPLTNGSGSCYFRH